VNYEELVESRNGAAMSGDSLPFGQFSRKRIDGKYANVVDIREDLLDSLSFTYALNTEAERNKGLVHQCQMHFTLTTTTDGQCLVKTDQGNFTTFERLLTDNPAVVAGKDFIVGTVRQLLQLTSYLHDRGVLHICYAPCNVMARKMDRRPMLLFHGSFYEDFGDQMALYGDKAAEFIAPEVLDEKVFDTRADIYSIGRFMDYLYRQSEVPIELKGVIRKATETDPDKRYQTPEDMLQAMAVRQHSRSVAMVAAGVLIAALVGYGLYTTMNPEPEKIEFVKAAPEAPEDDLLDDGLDPTTELGLPLDTTMASVDERKMREYNSKAEQIFRKQFTRKAEGILSKIYNNERMNANEKAFLATSQSTMQELVKASAQLGIDAGLPASRSQLIAGQIIEAVSNRLKAQADSRRKARVNGFSATRRTQPEEESPLTARPRATEAEKTPEATETTQPPENADPSDPQTTPMKTIRQREMEMERHGIPIIGREKDKNNE